MNPSKNIFYRSAYWIFFFALYSAIIIAIGAIAFSFIAPIVGIFLLPQYTLAELFYKGMSIGARYAGVWAGGTSIVLCFMRAAWLRKANAA